MKTLVAGWFSFQQGHATAGDLLARDIACNWLQLVDHQYDIALAPPFEGGVNWRQVDPHDYSHVIFVCGPFQQSELEVEFLERFSQCRLIGLNLSMKEPLWKWNPFDLLLERDSSQARHPDMVFLSPPSQVPVVGVCLVESYPEGQDAVANEAIKRLLDSHEAAVVEIDTRLDAHSINRLRSPGEIESLIARMDILVTTRLHGLVLALKNGVPTIAIDPEAGGAKIRLQAELLDWPVNFVVDKLDEKVLAQAFKYCQTDEARLKVRQCCQHAQMFAREMQEEFLAEMREGVAIEKKFQERLARMKKDIRPPSPLEDESVRRWPSFWGEKFKKG